jgi:hypothetical protein
VVPLKTVVDYVRQKLLATLACLKDRAVQDRVQFAKDRGPFKIIEAAVIAIDFMFMPDVICRQTHGAHRLPSENICA